MIFHCPNFVCLSLMFMLSVELVHTRHLKVHKEPQYGKRDGAEKVSRGNLLWNLILTGKNSQPSARSGHLHSKHPQKHHQLHAKQRQLYERSRNDQFDVQEVHNVPLKLGLCNDQSPMCTSYVLNGLCDSPVPFQTLTNIHNLCAFSCGYCKETIPDGEVDFVGDGWNAE